MESYWGDSDDGSLIHSATQEPLVYLYLGLLALPLFGAPPQTLLLLVHPLPYNDEETEPYKSLCPVKASQEQKRSCTLQNSEFKNLSTPHGRYRHRHYETKLHCSGTMVSLITPRHPGLDIVDTVTCQRHSTRPPTNTELRTLQRRLGRRRLLRYLRGGAQDLSNHWHKFQN
jgi:hypothetical protein